ncbi:phosphoglycerate dehydrogenase [Streptomyces chitinivorans]|uniref:D-3-phosphoglycerate dehydrogenase n=1 Tax=Streptomyces chitinivorans TaxID=1257027 RepID=A0ABW7HZZ2_9ACTN|nr:phosphoglycerate dehydrogenase [Streptomyces chitinivorans]MDH2412277.1 phosphoglycerate dehydrogenase [Streptomyces chitinivorans]
MNKPVVLIAEDLATAAIETLGPDVEVRHCDGADRAALLAAVGRADALLVRSATRVDAEVLAAAPHLRVVARAGVGLDNVDVDAATRAGVAVVNAPTSNTVTAAELACGLIISLARHIPQADAALRAGEWRRSRYMGVELAGKTLGVVGLGRIGKLVARRMAAFDMRVIAHDPNLSVHQAEQAGAELLSLDDLLETADFITVHLPRTPETTGLIGRDELRRAKPGVRIVNAARGGIVDEQALAEALREGHVAGAGLDVFTVEPCTDSPLFGLDTVVATPHLGASTVEAQDKAGVAVAHAVRRALTGELIAGAVNVHGGAVAKEVGPLLPLAENLGRIFTALADGLLPAGLHVEVRGEITRHDVAVLERAALKGVLTGTGDTPLTLVNAPLLARERIHEVWFTTSSECDRHRDVITVRGTLPDGREIGVRGTPAGPRQVGKLVGIGDYDIELGITGHMVFLRYKDMPGMIGTIGQILGEAGINIAVMQVARITEGGEAAVALTVDNAVPATVLDTLGEAIGASSAHFVDLTV